MLVLPYAGDATQCSKMKVEKNRDLHRNGVRSKIVGGPANPHTKFENDPPPSVDRLRNEKGHVHMAFMISGKLLGLVFLSLYSSGRVPKRGNYWPKKCIGFSSSLIY